MDLTQKLKNKFVITTELGPVKGALANESVEKARAYSPLDAINIHDCPMANLRINSVSMASLIQKELGVPAIPHFTCRDRSLLGTQADLLGAHALGIRHILVTTGDPPKHGPFPSKAVYDYNTLDLIKLIKKMNAGVDFNDNEFGGQTEFNIACTAMPTSRDPEREIERMNKKKDAGADFFQTQVVYDVEKAVPFFEKAKKTVKKPMIVGIMPLKSIKMAKYMKDKVEGIDVPDHIIEKMESGQSGIDIACEVIKDLRSYVDGIHIMAMGDVKGTNQIIEFSESLTGS